MSGRFLCADPCKCEKAYMQVFHVRNMPLRWRMGRAASRGRCIFPTRLHMVSVERLSARQTGAQRGVREGVVSTRLSTGTSISTIYFVPDVSSYGTE